MQPNLCGSIVVLHPADNVAVVVSPLKTDTVIATGQGSIISKEPIAPGHKIALRAISSGEQIFKYGEVIGHATQDIPEGAWVHVHNLIPDFDGAAYEYATRAPATDYFPADEAGTFLGYKRENGDVGTRNYVAVIATSNCSSHVAVEIAERMKHVCIDTHGVDGVVAIPHQKDAAIRRGGHLAVGTHDGRNDLPSECRRGSDGEPRL